MIYVVFLDIQFFYKLKCKCVLVLFLFVFKDYICPKMLSHDIYWIYGDDFKLLEIFCE